MKKFLIIFSVLFILIGCRDKVKKEQLDFFCGSAVKVPMEEIISNFEKKTGIKVNVIYSGSGNLLAQMELSKKGDVYLCGSPDYIIIGEKRGLLKKNTDRKIAYLVPAILTPKGNPKSVKTLEDLTNKGVRVGIGNPETVCLGLYATEIFDANNILEKVFPNIVVFAKGCAATENLVVLGKVDAIIGWKVFKNWNPDKTELILIEPEKIKRLAYVAIAVAEFNKNRYIAEKFINYVLSKDGKVVFKKWGYITDEKSAKQYAPEASIGGEYKLPEKYFQLVGKK